MAVFRGAIMEDACAQFRHQRRKLRPAGTELLAEFRSQARMPSMIDSTLKNEKRCFFLFIDFFNIYIILTVSLRVSRLST